MRAIFPASYVQAMLKLRQFIAMCCELFQWPGFISRVPADCGMIRIGQVVLWQIYFKSDGLLDSSP